ncbi:MAG: nicotinate (nicotinamide) nucleotide adenylyltransferase [Phycisphaerales bacterium]|nr:MAG: nicotinate (nicotinamide) nucleotide adenylyltransferase [Phycisphaerales bacterium]
MPEATRILIFGGTFDPPHRAHRILPPMVAEKLSCAEILYIPAAINPLKLDTRPTLSEHRLAMLKLVVASVPKARIATMELEREGPSYTVDTLRELKETHGRGTELRLLIGADQAASFHRWRDWETIVELARPAVMLRTPWDDSESLEAQWREHHDAERVAWWRSCIVPLPNVPVSSTDVRERIQRCEPLTDLLDPPVIEYIFQHGLYGANAD